MPQKVPLGPPSKHIQDMAILSTSTTVKLIQVTSTRNTPTGPNTPGPCPPALPSKHTSPHRGQSSIAKIVTQIQKLLCSKCCEGSSLHSSCGYKANTIGFPTSVPLFVPLLWPPWFPQTLQTYFHLRAFALAALPSRNALTADFPASPIPSAWLRRQLICKFHPFQPV